MPHYEKTLELKKPIPFDTGINFVGRYGLTLNHKSNSVSVSKFSRTENKAKEVVELFETELRNLGYI